MAVSGNASAMTDEKTIVELAAWLQTAPGRHLLQWESERLDAAVADIFGFHALQLGMPELAGLRANRMPHRWLGLEQHEADQAQADPAVALLCDFDALPFASSSLDLVLLPHTLEFAPDPHHMLREVERVLRPEGRVVITGLNPASAWGLRQNLGHLVGRLPLRQTAPYLPSVGEFIGYWRLRDWLRLLSFDVEAADFGLYAPPLRSEKWLRRWDWIEPVGRHWWPVLGAVYFIVAVKRVHGMRLIELKRARKTRVKARAAVALSQRGASALPASAPIAHSNSPTSKETCA